jgi:4-amino-4-deoxy-L-arabinose transferase-like glycosyltransferase
MQFFGARQGRYNNTNRVIAAINQNEAIALNDEYRKFQRRYGEITKSVNEALKENNVQKAVENLELFNEIFQRMEDIYKKYETEYKKIPDSLEPVFQQLQQDLSETVSSLKIQLNNSRSELFQKIQTGIDTLLQIKRELGVTGTFKEKIEGEILKTKIISFIYLWSFIGILILIPVLVASTFILDEFRTLKWYEAYFVRLSIVAPLVWIAAFLHKNYSLRSVAAMKFDHLERLLGGGAATIADLVKGDSSAQAVVYKRLSELFLDMKDLSDIASREARPSTKAVKEALEIVKDMKVTPS